MNRRDFIRSSSLAAAAVLGTRRLVSAEASQGPVRVAQIGTAHSHAPAKWTTLVRHPQLFTAVGIWEPDATERTRAAARPEYAGARWLEERDLFGVKSIEAVAVETELPDLLKMGRRVVDAGWHLHLDKPPGRKLDDFIALQKAAQRGRRVLQTGYMYRYHPAFRFCLDAVKSGWLGRVTSVDGDMSSEMAADRRVWLAEAYGGSMMLLGCHLVDIAVALMGEPSKVVGHRRRSRPEVDGYFDHEVAVLEYPNGLATIRCANFQMGGGARRSLVVCGEKGTIEILPLEPAKVRLTLKQAAGRFVAGGQEVALPAVAGRYDAMMTDFAQMIRGGKSTAPEFDAVHELRVHRAVMACAEAT